MEAILGIKEQVILVDLVIELFEDKCLEFADIGAKQVEEAIASGGVEHDDEEDEVDVDDEEMDEGVEEAQDKLQPNLFRFGLAIDEDLGQLLEIRLPSCGQHDLENHNRKPHAVQLHCILSPEEVV